MDLSVLTSIVSFLGGLGMFIYGMHVMAEGLQQAAGEKTKQLLGALTNNRFLAVCVGALVTAIIQSSSATTVMVVGFVNAQIMNLMQAVGVIMGANIGTTMTGWLVSMSEWGALLKPDMFAPVLLLAGVFIILFTKNMRAKQGASILIGFGLLFIGLGSMSGTVKPYADSPIFYQAFTVIGSNPLFGLLVGALVTAIIQSSSASMGILQTLALNGVVNWSSAAFIALGQNIGTCVTALISCIGASKNAQRAAVIHLLFNIIGSLIVGLVVWIYFLMYPAVATSLTNSTALALFHTGFNVATTIMLFPFASWLVKMSEMIIPETHKDEDAGLVKLDDRLLANPGFALGSVRVELNRMAKLTMANILYSRDILLHNANFVELHENEKKINEYEKEMYTFLTKMNLESLSPAEQFQVKYTMLTINDLERISDHCKNIANAVQDNIDEKVFHESEVEDINFLCNHCYDALKYAMEIYNTHDKRLYDKVQRYDLSMIQMETAMRESHMERLIENQTPVESGILFLLALNNYLRISDHAKAIGHYVLTEGSVVQ